MNQADSLEQWVLDPQKSHARVTCGILALWQILGVKQCRTEAKVYVYLLFFTLGFSAIRTFSS